MNEATTDTVLLAAIEQFEDQTTTRVLIAALEEYEDSRTIQKEDVKKTPAKMLPSTHCISLIPRLMHRLRMSLGMRLVIVCVLYAIFVVNARIVKVENKNIIG